MGVQAIATYDPGWPACFEAERAALLAAIGGALVDIAHVGSTAVPGLAARPTIDILAGLAPTVNVASCLAPLEGLDYAVLAGDAERQAFGRAARRAHPAVRLELVAHGGAWWDRLLLFRDTMRAHPKQALHYQQLKHVLAARCGDDVAAYQQGKSGFVRVIDELARTERDRG